MKIYNFTTVKETTIIGDTLMTQDFQLPIDEFGIVPPDYLHKFRAIQNNQMIVFEDEQEYINYLNNLTL